MIETLKNIVTIMTYIALIPIIGAITFGFSILLAGMIREYFRD